MPKYLYAGETELFYPGILIPGEGSLTARPGDERDFDGDPPPGNWVLVQDAPLSPPPPPAPPAPPKPPVNPPDPVKVSA